MKAKICNLGALKEGEIDIKPLTVFIGHNNTGKTWTAYTLSALLGPHGLNSYLKNCSYEEFAILYPPLYEAIEQLLNEGNSKFDILGFANDYIEVYLTELTKNVAQSMHKVINTKHNRFENLELSLNLTDTKSQFLEAIKSRRVKRKIGRNGESGLLNLDKKLGDAILYMYTEANIADKIPVDVIRELLVRRLFELIHRAIYPQVYIFPVERTTFVSFPFVQARPLREVDSTYELSDNEQPIGFQNTIGNFLTMIQGAFDSNLLQRQEAAKKNTVVTSYMQLADLLEKSVLGGNVTFSSSENTPNRELLYQPSENISLELPIASSMVKELTPFVLCLRYLAEKGELLIIDEPEMNLHPEAQARFMEFLAMLVQAGLHVLIMTHSPYMVDHLSNLMKAATIEDKEAIKDKFYLQRSEAFIPQSQVSVQLFENGTVRDILEDDGIIDWSTFGRVSGRVSRLYFDIQES